MTQRLVCPHDCPDTCSMLVDVEDGQAVESAGNPEHRVHAGVSVPQGLAVSGAGLSSGPRDDAAATRSGRKGRGQFAADFLGRRRSTKLPAGFAKSAPVPTDRRRFCPTATPARWARFRAKASTGGSSTGSGRRCWTARSAPRRAAPVIVYTIGSKQGTDPEAFGDSRYIINWGSNTAVTNSHLWVRMVEARKRGAKIVTIDPYRSRTAERSDWHLAPKVGTDAALALGIMHVLFRDGLIDAEYVEPALPRRRTAPGPCARRSIRSRELRQSPDWRRPTSNDWPANTPRFRRAVIRINYGLQRHYGGGMAVRTIACLPALIGALAASRRRNSALDERRLSART